MATEFKLPDLGENIASGDVVTVFVSEGDVVKPGQPLLEVETDKAVIEVPCPPGGLVEKVLVKKGDTVKVGETLVLLGSMVDAAPKPAAAAPAKPAAEPAPQPVLEPVRAAAPVVENGQRTAAPAALESDPEPVSVRAAVATAVEPAGPSVRRLARELGVDLSRVTGSGPAAVAACSCCPRSACAWYGSQPVCCVAQS